MAAGYREMIALITTGRIRATLGCVPAFVGIYFAAWTMGELYLAHAIARDMYELLWQTGE